MSRKAKRILMIVGILTGLAVATLLFTNNNESATSRDIRGTRHSFFKVVSSETSWKIVQTVNQFLNNQ